MPDMHDALAAQILAEVRAVGAKVSGIEITVAQAVERIQHRSDQVDDHEDRLRKLEAVDVVTVQALEESQRERSRKTIAILAVGLTLFGLVETAVLAVLFRG
jgi:hypothetical protein